MRLVLNIRDDKAGFFIELLRNFPFVTTEEMADSAERTEAQVLDDLREALEEVKLAKEGKIELQSARAFLDEL
jgi:hypothetical protein